MACKWRFAAPVLQTAVTRGYSRALGAVPSIGGSAYRVRLVEADPNVSDPLYPNSLEPAGVGDDELQRLTQERAAATRPHCGVPSRAWVSRPTRRAARRASGPTGEQVQRLVALRSDLCSECEHHEVEVGGESHSRVGQLELPDQRMLESFDSGVVCADAVACPAEAEVLASRFASITRRSGSSVPGRAGCSRLRRVGRRRRRPRSGRGSRTGVCTDSRPEAIRSDLSIARFPVCVAGLSCGQRSRVPALARARRSSSPGGPTEGTP